ncbi:MAG: 2-C-methyl-D-erythritol 4-phosphate cytidylyltransferase [Acidimicrobiaceae bacterium]|nr:2-C-methyl-D-erythritol 4-phosphate cytidylyltransferase [Acidimicrobiaceae bacterium]|tara:strand:- start:1086 stop:1829 length:744 start_codon:yes stop_codon:yes gene_type:complete
MKGLKQVLGLYASQQRFQVEEIMLDAILLAAGRSTRLGSDFDKQLHRVGNKPLVIFSAELLLEHSDINRLVVVANEDRLDNIQSVFTEFSLTQYCDFVLGGEERQESVRNSLEAIQSDRVLLHEGARPVISHSLIERVLRPKSACVTPTIPVPFTVAVGQAKMEQELDRSSLHNIQLPQAFDTQKLVDAHSHAYSESFQATDDSALLFRMGHSVEFVEGEVTNIKVTYPTDLVLVEELLRERRTEQI